MKEKRLTLQALVVTLDKIGIFTSINLKHYLYVFGGISVVTFI